MSYVEKIQRTERDLKMYKIENKCQITFCNKRFFYQRYNRDIHVTYLCNIKMKKINISGPHVLPLRYEKLKN